MKTIVLTILIPGVILFFLLDLVARELLRKLRETKLQAEREAALAESLRLDFTRESETLRRVDVKDPAARILCVDDEVQVDTIEHQHARNFGELLFMQTHLRFNRFEVTDRISVRRLRFGGHHVDDAAHPLDVAQETSAESCALMSANN